MALVFTYLKSFYTVLFGWLPPWLGAVTQIAISLLIVIIVVKLIAFILDIIPFV